MSHISSQMAVSEEVVMTAITDLKNGKIRDAIARFADKFRFKDYALGLEFTDIDQLGEFFQKTRELYPDSVLRTETIFLSADHVITEWTLQTILTESFYGLTRRVPISLNGTSIVRTENGLITDWADYYDGQPRGAQLWLRISRNGSNSKRRMKMYNSTTIVVTGSTGNLGGRIVKSILKQGAAVRAIVRTGTARDKSEALTRSGASVVEVDFHELKQVVEACTGASCVVSTFAGLRDVIVDTQRILVDACVKAGVPRYIPSDFSADYTKWPQPENRTLDLRREFNRILDKTAIRSTSILNGAFLDLLLGPFPAFNLEKQTVTYWGDPDSKIEFTKLDDIAAFTALASLDASTPRTLRIVGERISARELAMVAQEVSGERFEVINGGTIAELSDTISRLQKATDPADRELYPDWQRMMYMRTMFGHSAEVGSIDNQRYHHLHWTSARELLEARFAATSPNRRQ